MRSLLRPAIVAAILTTASSARAQLGEGQVLNEGGTAIDAHEVYPARGLIVRERMATVFSGLNLNLTDGAYLEPFSIPVGAAYGVIEDLEVGADVSIVLNRPDPLSFAAVSEPRLYGRYAILPGMLAVDGSVFLPDGKDGDAFGFKVKAPFRYQATEDLIVLAAAAYSGFFGGYLTDYSDYEQLSATGIYSVIPKFWVALELGITARKFDFGDARVPVGFAAGYELIPGFAILPGFRFPDIGEPKIRVLQVLAVYTLDLFGGKVAEAEKDTPDIPLSPQPR